MDDNKVVKRMPDGYEDQTEDARIIYRTPRNMYIEDYVKYSIIVVRRRAFAEVRDSFKPVQRRVLEDMYEMKAINRSIKSARIVGDTMGKYHPHGDSSIYEAMGPLAQFWKCKLPLITPGSNFGTIMGDKLPHMRYSEARLSKFAMECIFGDIEETIHSCNWKDNFDMTEKEPEYLPVKVPLLLINGSFGIGVATSNSSIPPHNPIEVIEATRALIRDPNTEVVLAPDFCVPVDIVNTDWKAISNSGYGKFSIRGKIEISEDKGNPIIRIKSLPPNVNNYMIKDKLLEMIEKKQLPMIKDIGDESSNERGVDMIITLRKGCDPTYLAEILYSKVGLASNEYVNFYVIDDINPKRMTYKEYLLSFIDFRATTKFRVYCNRFKDNRTRCHKLETYIKVGRSGEIDNIIKMVKKQKTISREEVREYLIKKLNITDIQAEFILSIEIMRLSEGYLVRYEEEYNQLIKEQDHIRKAITDGGKTILEEIDQELYDIEQKYGTPRLCQIIDHVESTDVPKGIFKIVLTSNNLVRKIPDTDKITVVRKDNPKFIVRIDNTENLLLFDNKGRVFKLPVSKIPVTDKTLPGTDVRILAKNLTADVIAMWPENVIRGCVDGGTKHHMVVVTKGNIIKKLDMEDFLSVSLSGLIYSKLKDNDTVASIAIVPAALDVVIYSKQKALRCNINDIPLFKRNASGSKAMETDYEIEGLSILYPDTDKVAVVTESGRINVFPMVGLPTHKRARVGSNVIKLSPNDSIVAIYGVSNNDKLKLVTADGIVEVAVADLKLKSGVAAGDKIAGVVAPVIRCDLEYNVQ